MIKLDNVAASSLANALVSCTGYEACLIQDGKHIWSYKLESTKSNKFFYKSTKNKSPASLVDNNKNVTSNTTAKTCKDSNISLSHFCSTHWNPPAHLSEYGCNHLIEWHSPYSCHLDTTNYQRPCYVYDLKGRLIDLTPWIATNGSSYEVDTSKVIDSSVKKFNINICNEAHDACGPNVSACYAGEKGHIESGYNNLTSINYDGKHNTVILTSLGQHNDQCPDQRVKTVVNFICRNKLVSKSKPQLMRSSVCESSIEWETMHACPITDTRAPATKCSIYYPPLNMTIDIKSLTNNKELIEVPNITINGEKKSMMLGICQGISSKTLSCEGKSTSTTSACLLEANLSSNLTSLSANVNNSEIVGTISKSYIRFADNRLYLESQPLNKSCSFPQGPNFNATKQISTRIEFYCSSDSDIQDKPTFLGFNECVYVFEWGSKAMCFETYPVEASQSTDGGKVLPKSSSSEVDPKKLSDKKLKINLEEDPKTPVEMHKETTTDAKKIIQGHNESIKKTKTTQPESDKDEHQKSNTAQAPLENKSSNSVNSTTEDKSANTEPKKVTNLKQLNGNNRMDKLHKFFMICLIVMSLGGFMIFIFILDKKTKLRIPLGNITRQTRQAFQPQPVPYTRVDQFNDLDL